MKKAIVIAVLAAFLLPLAASAESGERKTGTKVEGPATLAGAGFFGGELETADPDETRPVVIRGQRGYVGVLDLAGDLKVRCIGHGDVVEKETEQGTVYLCKGQRGTMRLSGSNYRLRGFAKRFVIHVPEGTAGELHGRFRDGASQGERGVRSVRGDTTERPAVGERPIRGDAVPGEAGTTPAAAA